MLLTRQNEPIQVLAGPASDSSMEGGIFDTDSVDSGGRISQRD